MYPFWLGLQRAFSTIFVCPLQAAKSLADAVIPNEYGIAPEAKLCIGSKICCNLLGKLLADLHNMREESIATAVGALSPSPSLFSFGMTSAAGDS